MAGVEGPTVRFDLLGPVRVVSDGQALRLGPTQQRAVLAVLARAPGRVLPREYLIDAIWGQEPPGYVVNLIQKHMSGLRRVFAAVPGGRDLVKWTGTGYVLDVDEEAVDLSRAERLIAAGRDRAAQEDLRVALADFDAALTLWRGTPFDGLNVPLLETERERVDELQLSAIEARLQVLSRLGRHAETVAELTSLVGRHPLRESIWEALMLELFRSGRQADALATYQRLRTILQDELGIDPSARMRELHLAVLTSDPALTSAGVAVDAEAGRADTRRADAAAARPAPAQLPPRMRHMVGRESQLAILDDALTGSRVGAPHEPHVAGVTGPAGVGKTAFALAWAHSARSRFPDGQLYINLRGFDPSGEVVDPLDAVRYFVDAFGIPSDGMPTTAEGLVALYRSLLADRKMLIVLDNARDVDQVRLLLPGSSSCVVAVTSRNLLSGLMVDYDAELIALDLFREDDSRALLARRLGEARLAAAPQAVGEIIERCGGLPLTLAIVAGRAVAHPEFPLPDIAAELRTAGSQLDPFEAEDGSVDVRSVFSWSYDKLSESAACVFRLLGLSPSPETSVPAAASLAALPMRQVRTVLNELARLHLLIERAPGRYVMHDLVRAHALELATVLDPEFERTAAVRRLLQHYLHTVDKAAEQLVGARTEPIAMPARPPGVEIMDFADHEAALDWLRAEFGAIHASWVRARELGDRAYICQLATRFSAYLEYRADWTLMEQMLSVASAAARDGQAIVVQAQLCRVLGQTLIRLERYPDARSRLVESFDCYRDVGDLVGMAHVERLLAWTYERESRPADMIEHAAHGVEIARELGDDAAIGRALNGLGWFYALDDKLADARDCCTSALTLLRASADRFGQAETLDSLGLIHFRMGDVKAGERYYLESAEIFSSFGDEFNAADTLANLGDAMAGAGMLDEATAVWTSALAAMRRLGSAHAQAVQDRISAAERVGQG